MKGHNVDQEVCVKEVCSREETAYFFLKIMVTSFYFLAGPLEENEQSCYEEAKEIPEWKIATKEERMTLLRKMTHRS